MFRYLHIITDQLTQRGQADKVASVRTPQVKVRLDKRINKFVLISLNLRFVYKQATAVSVLEKSFKIGRLSRRQNDRSWIHNSSIKIWIKLRSMHDSDLLTPISPNIE